MANTAWFAIKIALWIILGAILSGVSYYAITSFTDIIYGYIVLVAFGLIMLIGGFVKVFIEEYKKL